MAWKHPNTLHVLLLLLCAQGLLPHVPLSLPTVLVMRVGPQDS